MLGKESLALQRVRQLDYYIVPCSNGGRGRSGCDSPTNNTLSEAEQGRQERRCVGKENIEGKL